MWYGWSVIKACYFWAWGINIYGAGGWPLSNVLLCFPERPWLAWHDPHLTLWAFDALDSGLKGFSREHLFCLDMFCFFYNKAEWGMSQAHKCPFMLSTLVMSWFQLTCVNTGTFLVSSSVLISCSESLAPSAQQLYMVLHVQLHSSTASCVLSGELSLYNSLWSLNSASGRHCASRPSLLYEISKGAVDRLFYVSYFPFSPLHLKFAPLLPPCMLFQRCKILGNFIF